MMAVLDQILGDFFWRALLAGIGITLIAAPLGCMIVWRRMAYFGDTISHAALMGVAFGFLIDIGPTSGVFAAALLVALALLVFIRLSRIAPDTILGILSHATLSIGLVVLASMTWVQIDLLGYLFGDVLAVSRADLAIIWLGGPVLLAVTAWIWRDLLALTVNEDLAAAEGVARTRTEALFMILIAFTIAVAMKIVGILLITAMLIIPAATARRFAMTPEGMVVITAFVGALSVFLGLYGSLQYDTASGPSIVVAAFSLFLLSLIVRPVQKA